MKRAYKHSMAWLLVCGLFVLTGCEKPEPYRVVRNDALYLSLNAALPDEADVPAAKAGDARYLASDKIRSLRIVLVSQSDDNGSWTVEANECYTLANTGGYMPGDLIYAVSHTRHKRIYLFGNCEETVLRNAAGDAVDLRTDYSVFVPDAATGRAPVEDFRFSCERGAGHATANRDAYVPMSAVYQIELPAKIEDIPVVGNSSHVYTVPKPLYLIRAVTKFTAVYENATADRAPVNIRVRGWTVSKVAKGSSYLLARVDDKWRETTKPAGDETDWQYWLAGEAAKTQDKGYRSYEWMYAYDLPEPEHEDYVCAYDSTDYYNIYHDSKQVLSDIRPVYLPESKNSVAAGTAAGPQSYVLKIRTWEWEDDYRLGRAMTYTLTLPECQSLFRNTNVYLNVKFLGDAVSLQATVCPWERHEVDIPAFE